MKKNSCVKSLVNILLLLTILIALSVTSGGNSIPLFATFGAPIGIASASFSFAFSTTTGIVKKLLKAKRNKTKKHKKIIMIAWVKLNRIEITISKVLINEINREDFKLIINEEKTIQN